MIKKMQLSRLFSKKIFFSYIKNTNVPVCVNCVHFIEDPFNYPYDPPPNNSRYGKCKTFGQINLITGELEYEYASTCRISDAKCGLNGKHFTKK
jgi:hypothetical protein